MCNNKLTQLRLYKTKIKQKYINATKQTALDRDQTDHISLTHDLDLDLYDLGLQSLRVMAMTYSHTKVQNQRSVGYEDRVEKIG